MRIGYIDATAGVSGDMILGSLVDAGWPLVELQHLISKLCLPEVRVEAEKVKRCGLVGTKVYVFVPHEHEHRHLSEIKSMISTACLPEPVKLKSIAVFQRMAEAEGEVHGVSPDQVHFHEVGAVDAIVDIVGACMGFNSLKLDAIHVSPLRLGNGIIQCHHGSFPVPAPATAALLKNIPVFAGEETGEWTTPTGAAIIRELAGNFGPVPKLSIQAVGYGAGEADPKFPNLLRLMIGEQGSKGEEQEESVNVIETTIDDMPGEYYTYLTKQLQQIPIKDYFITPVQMKKNRPGQLLTVICDLAVTEQVADVIFQNSSTFGLRITESKRYCLKRDYLKVNWGDRTIRVKVGYWQGEVVQIAPEYEECRQVAENAGVSLNMVYLETKMAAKNMLFKKEVKDK